MRDRSLTFQASVLRGVSELTAVGFGSRRRADDSGGIHVIHVGFLGHDDSVAHRQEQEKVVDFL